MNFIYTKIMNYLVGEALAKSDRIKVAVAGAISVVLTNLLGACQICQAILSPEVVNNISMTIAGTVVTLILSITHRDTLTPYETAAAGKAVAPMPPLKPLTDEELKEIGDPPVLPE